MSTDLEIVKDNAKLTAITVRSGAGAEIATAQDAWTLASMYHRAGMAPTSFKTPQQVFVAFLAASELGVGPSFAMRWMMVINNVPAVWGDGPMALVERSGLQESWSTGTVGKRGTDDFGVWFETTRKGRAPHRVVFTKGDAVHAGLWSKPGPWKSYPERMMLARARAYALRNTYPDVLGGVAIAEEERDHDRSAAPESPATGSAGLLAALAPAVEPGEPEEAVDVPWDDVEAEVRARDGALFEGVS
jgi:hypothetical protein